MQSAKEQEYEYANPNCLTASSLCVILKKFGRKTLQKVVTFKIL